MKLNNEKKDALKVMVKSLPKGIKFDNKAEKEIFAVLYFKSLKNNGNLFTCGYNTIESECGYSRHTISTYVSSLEDKKYIKHTQGSTGKNTQFEVIFDHENNMDNNMYNCPCKPTENQSVTSIFDTVDCPCINDTNSIHDDCPCKLTENQSVTMDNVHGQFESDLDTKYKYKYKYNNKYNYYTTNTNTIDYSVLEEMIDRIIENKINKLINTMTTTTTNYTTIELEGLVTKLVERVNSLESTVNFLVENNNILVQRLNKASVVIKGLMANKTTVQPVQSVQQKSVVDIEEKKKISDKITQLWSVIDDKDASMKSKLPAVQELKEVIKSDLASDKQKYYSQLKIDKFAELESENSSEELISSKIESVLNQHFAMREAFNREDYEYVKANGEEYLKTVQEVEQLKKDKKLSKEAYTKVNTITRNTSTYNDVEDYLQLVASNKLEDTKHTKKEVADAKKSAEIDKLNILNTVRHEINNVFNRLVDKLSGQNYKAIEGEFKIDFNKEVNKITLYNPKEHLGLSTNVWSRLLNEINVHNSNY